MFTATSTLFNLSISERTILMELVWLSGFERYAGIWFLGYSVEQEDRLADPTEPILLDQEILPMENSPPRCPIRFQHILGVRFIVADAQDAIDVISRAGGLVVVPSAPSLKDLTHDSQYREAMLSADFAIADSALMVMLWNLLQKDRIPKLSGLKYLRALLEQPGFREPGATFWVMPSVESAEKNAAWLCNNGFDVSDRDFYVAPVYDKVFHDPDLLRRLEEQRPAHVVLGVGGGTQEPLGFYIKQNLGYRPAIHCIGAAIAFLSGDQVHIPVWADHLGLGWLWRSISDPARYGTRYWKARRLVPLIFRYRDKLPYSA